MLRYVHLHGLSYMCDLTNYVLMGPDTIEITYNHATAACFMWLQQRFGLSLGAEQHIC